MNSETAEQFATLTIEIKRWLDRYAAESRSFPKDE